MHPSHLQQPASVPERTRSHGHRRTRRVVIAACASALLGACLGCTPCALAAGDASTLPGQACPNESSPGFRAYLPDCRALELVSPPYKDGYQVVPQGISEDGARVLGSSLGAFAGGGGAPATRHSIGVYYELARAADGWHANPLTPENPEFRAATTFRAASRDLSRTLFTLPSAPMGQEDFYIRGPGSSLADVGPAWPPADGPAQEPAPIGVPASSVHVEGGSADLSHIVYGLKGGVGWNGDPTASGHFNPYEYVGTGNSMPEMVAVTGGHGSTALIGQCGARVGGPEFTSAFNAVSEDGKTIFFTIAGVDSQTGCSSPQPAFSELYARVNGSETISLAAAHCQSGCAAEPLSATLFAGASGDGSKVFFSSTQKLTEQASEDTTAGDSAFYSAGSGCEQAQGTGCNLYEAQLGEGEGKTTVVKSLLTLSAGSTEPHVQGVVRISQDGSHVYFVAQGKLTEEENARGEQAQAGMNNLYVFERDEAAPQGRTRYVTTLAPSEEAVSSDEELWGGSRGTDNRPAQATPDGRFLVFESHADLTSDDTSKGVWQVFEYDADQTAQEIKEGIPPLVRVSVGNDGFNHDGNTDEYNATIRSPGYMEITLPSKLSLSNDGRFVFFQSAADLTPGMGSPEAGTGAATSNVYEYHDGTVYLIYGGNGSRVTFLGTSANGGDAFVYTIDELVPEDTDTQVDIYDVRVGGGPSAQSGASGCRGEVCLGALSMTPTFGVPASTTFSGLGNVAPSTSTSSAKAKSKSLTRAQKLARALRTCRKKRGRSRGSCEREAHRHYGRVGR